MVSLLQQLVTDQAEHRPDGLAIVTAQERISYGELEEQSNRLARVLEATGCEKGDRVCFLIPKSPVAIVSILGILKADCIHVPLDTSSPAPRLAKIVESCEPRSILAAGPVASVLDELMADKRSGSSVSIGWMDKEPAAGKTFKPEFTWADLLAHSNAPLDCRNKSNDPAHILFTSGSTGTPKGVIITHSNVIHFVEWARKHFGMRPSDRISGHPPLHFDLSTYDIFGSFAAGAELHLVPPELNLLPNKLADFIRDSELTQWFSVPSVLSYMARFDAVGQNDFPALERILWCGEVFGTTSLIYWMKRLPKVQFTNLYGPTETTIASAYYTVPKCPEDEKVAIPIGKGCDGEELLVLDDELQPVPQGEIGNLYIRGVGLSPGYWRDSQKTSTVFLRDPFSSNPGDRIYRTGDLAKVDEAGLVHFLGRADSQIKTRGYRVELGEIETALNAIDSLADCAVVAINSNGFEGTTICCAYVPRVEANVSPTDLRKDLGRVLPSYMLPARWMAFDRLPQNGNGKVDRPILRERFQQSGESRS